MKSAKRNGKVETLLRRGGSRLIMAAFLMGVAVQTQGEGWETVFTVPPAQNPNSNYYYDRSAGAILPDPFAPPGSPATRLFVGMRSDEHSLYVVDLHNGTGTGTVLSNKISWLGFDPSSQSLFAGSGGGRWVLSKSTDQGVSWTVLDSLTNSSGNGIHGPGCFLRDGEGNFFVPGSLGGSSFNSFSWIVRKSTDQGATWTTVYQLPNVLGGRGTFVPGNAGGLFVLTRSAPEQWIVRRSRDAGATWQIVDSFMKTGKITWATTIVSDAQGRIYVAGYSEPDGTTAGTWEVRVSDNGGDSWKTISPPAAPAQRNSELRAMIVDPAGNLFVAGMLDAWAVARRTPDGVWQAPELPFGTESGWVPSSADAMAVDTVGNIFVAGVVKSGGPYGAGAVVTPSLVVQKLAATVLPRVRIARAGDSLVLSWPATLTGYQLESTATVGMGAVWEEVPTLPVVIGDEQSVTVDIGAGPLFFRLRKP